MSIFSNLFGANQEKVIPNKVITLEKLEEMFERMKETPGWDLDAPLLWGYFFTNDEPQKLEKTKEILEKKGYRFVDIYISDKENESDPDQFWLHVEKVETHSPQSLDKRNDEFYLLAHELGLKSYDGMDVGLTETKPKEIQTQ
ncbi:ribonuclease E inhibitor RraB [Cerasicoccus arenae]|uniref:Regulator of ribonuclease activity B domain-containing protein n=1 Tax=Cerasicoccus arenae TaxID=424488 RepID=A0A8J3D906_9BACT|nr:ribonuclease E inhibitor RraB [Cerasicoccus arenae]MBK1860097.1 ribonuclease E inhibitor RraB [Cerasicoccus arenae]GHB97049.1 hypothetical protein GCM10007047_11290 [Cerasicoccus arenae]